MISTQTGVLATIRDAVTADDRQEQVVGAVAAALAEAGDELHALMTPTVIAPPDRTTSRIVHAEQGFSIVCLTLPPGCSTSIHDHVTWCVVAVVQGSEHETTYERRGRRLAAVGEHRNEQGSISTLLPPGDIHRVANDSDTEVASLHVYGADLRRAGSSVRRTYRPITTRGPRVAMTVQRVSRATRLFAGQRGTDWHSMASSVSTGNCDPGNGRRRS